MDINGDINPWGDPVEMVEDDDNFWGAPPEEDANIYDGNSNDNVVKTDPMILPGAHPQHPSMIDGDTPTTTVIASESHNTHKSLSKKKDNARQTKSTRKNTSQTLTENPSQNKVPVVKIPQQYGPYNIETVFRLIRTASKDEVRAYLEYYQSELTLNFFHAQGTPLMVAAQYGFVEVIDLLCEYGADVNIVNNENGFTALHYAAQGQNYQVMEHLLKQRKAVIPTLHLYDPSATNLFTFTLENFTMNSIVVDRYPQKAAASRQQSHVYTLLNCLLLMISSPAFNANDILNETVLHLYLEKVLRILEPDHTLTVHAPLPSSIPHTKEYHVLCVIVPPRIQSNLLYEYTKALPSAEQDIDVALQSVLEAALTSSIRFQSNDWDFGAGLCKNIDKAKKYTSNTAKAPMDLMTTMEENSIAIHPITAIKLALTHNTSWQAIVGLSLLMLTGAKDKPAYLSKVIHLMDIYQGVDMVMIFLDIILWISGRKVTSIPFSLHSYLPCLKLFIDHMKKRYQFKLGQFASLSLVNAVLKSKDNTDSTILHNRITRLTSILSANPSAFVNMSWVICLTGKIITGETVQHLLQMLANTTTAGISQADLDQMKLPPHPISSLLSSGHSKDVISLVHDHPQQFQSIMRTSMVALPTGGFRLAAELSSYWAFHDISKAAKEYRDIAQKPSKKPEKQQSSSKHRVEKKDRKNGQSLDKNGIITPSSHGYSGLSPQQNMFTLFEQLWLMDEPVKHHISHKSLLLESIHQDLYDFYTYHKLKDTTVQYKISNIELNPDLVTANDETTMESDHTQSSSQQIELERLTENDIKDNDSKISIINSRLLHRYQFLQFVISHKKTYPTLYQVYFDLSVEALTLVLSHLSSELNSPSLFGLVMNELTNTPNIATRCVNIRTDLWPSIDYTTLYILFGRLAASLSREKSKKHTIYERYCERHPAKIDITPPQIGSSRIHRSFPLNDSSELFRVLMTLHLHEAYSQLKERNHTKNEPFQKHHRGKTKPETSLGYNPEPNTWRKWLFVIPPAFILKLEIGQKQQYMLSYHELFDYALHSHFFAKSRFNTIMKKLIDFKHSVDTLWKGAIYEHPSQVNVHQSPLFSVPDSSVMFVQLIGDMRYAFPDHCNTTQIQENPKTVAAYQSSSANEDNETLLYIACTQGDSYNVEMSRYRFHRNEQAPLMGMFKLTKTGAHWNQTNDLISRNR